jgi:hypothetical protein
VKRLEQSLNKPIVVLVVGVVAVALNILLYFGYFLPRTTPLVEQIYSIGTSLPEAIGKSDPETGSKPDSKTGSNSDSETGSNSDPGASGKPNLEASGTSVSEGSLESDSDPSPDSPSGSPSGFPSPQQKSSAPHQSPAAGAPPPELPPLPTPPQAQYQ